MQEIIKKILELDTNTANNIYLNEIALLMEENEYLKDEVERLNKIIETNLRK